MKKFNLAVGTVLLGGALLLTGCGTDENEAKASAPNESESVENDQVNEVVEDTEDVVDLTTRNVEVTEYSTLELFMNDTSENWKEGSEYRQSYALADSILAESTIAYVNYFKDEITEKGLNEDFDEFQLLAYEVVQSNDEEDDYEEHVKRYEDKMNNILSKM